MHCRFLVPSLPLALVTHSTEQRTLVLLRWSRRKLECFLFLSRVIVVSPGPLGQVGSDFWMAPEVHSNRKATRASDVFSLHVVMWEVRKAPTFSVWCQHTVFPSLLPW